ncbi:MAG TPA: aspartate/glutamate racemase family protein, partial [Prolixibacteraceae bacterium]|nr:aspartate/glutamate racemase family protein [Prolixibacteraceae bacterium]
MERTHPIGIFDSGYGGLTILKEIRKKMPRYDYIYLGDNARTPYGTRSFDVVYKYTLQAVKKLFEMDCELVILACNTASAKALRTIQQNDLPVVAPNKRVLGVIRPSVEEVIHLTRNNHVGVLGTNGTVSSGSYLIELEKQSEGKLIVSQEACP